MSNYEYEDDDDDITTSESSNDLVKQLRKAAKQKDKELQELRAQFEGISKAQRERATSSRTRQYRTQIQQTLLHTRG
jgi:hypothetical protein